MNTETDTTTTRIDRAQGAMLGQLAGDALGSLVEFQTPEQIRNAYPNGVRDLQDGGTFQTLAGQPTDDSEMAILLARAIVDTGMYDVDTAYYAYSYWLSTRPFDCGNTIRRGIRGDHNLESQANGAMMRISPLGIFGAAHDLADVRVWAMEDARLTHPNRICQEANALYAMAIATAVREPVGETDLYEQILSWAPEMNVKSPLLEIIHRAEDAPPQEYIRNQGWILVAFQNALWQLLHAKSLEEGIIDTVHRGGDTDTNAAICGALLGACHGAGAIPDRWSKKILTCKPSKENPEVQQPRPSSVWPVDALELAAALIGE